MEMWGLRDFAVLGAWGVQALELQVRLQQLEHAAPCVALHRSQLTPLPAGRAVGIVAGC